MLTDKGFKPFRQEPEDEKEELVLRLKGQALLSMHKLQILILNQKAC